ncbi:DUF1800 domain-containing protein [Aeromicrobium sp.]|uniref:DUF1800 domain-containing protein n=1 Tax=Aeromicrobium sp. TaxID=1871063 RepID=UPI0019C86935|nr:DUF1800 domain-containing protein [Aeromicrobium sp.]MBC7633540.1 DUF1800 domain-containing protein [Aeromicrobium sp.]
MSSTSPFVKHDATLPSRRAVLTVAAVAGSTIAWKRAEATSTAPDATPGAEIGRDPSSVLHLLRRLTYGPTPELIEHVQRVGARIWLNDQLGQKSDATSDLVSATYLTLGLPAALLIHETGQRNPVQDLQAATFTRAAWGDRQVAELLVEFWSNHLSIYANAPQVRGLKLVDDREVVRPHALGRFNDLLIASARSPAMLRYLDGASSQKGHPNENYARELLELHTVGVESGFSQQDVLNTALVLTGRSVDDTTGVFTYRPEWHHVGPVRVLGWSAQNDDPADGMQVGDSLLAYLAIHPATATRLAEKLVRRLVSDTPSTGLVSSAARVYLRSGTGVVPVVRHIVADPTFAASAGRKSRRPLEWLTAAIRGLGLHHDLANSPTGANPLVAVLHELGHVPFDWHPPDGYPDVVGAWASTGTLLARWNVAQRLVRSEVPGLQKFDAEAFLGTPLPRDGGSLVDRVAVLLLGAPPRRGLRDPLLLAIDCRSNTPLYGAQALKLVPALAALVLSSPDMAVR